MTERINTTNADAVSAVFSPEGDFSVQASIPAGSRAYLDIEGRVDAAAGWVALGSIGALTSPPILRFARCPFVRLRLYNNDGAQVTAWSET